MFYYSITRRLYVNKRNVTTKFETYTQLWQILIQIKMWPIDEREIGIAGHIVAKSYSLQQAIKMRRYGSLIKINLSWKTSPDFHQYAKLIKYLLPCFFSSSVLMKYSTYERSETSFSTWC